MSLHFAPVPSERLDDLFRIECACFGEAEAEPFEQIQCASSAQNLDSALVAEMMLADSVTGKLQSSFWEHTSGNRNG